MPTESTPPIAILGAGPAGLTLACLLHQQSIPFVMFERDAAPSSSSPTRGGTLDLHTETGQLALRECGLFAEFKRLARYDGQAFKCVDKDRNVLVDMIPREGDDGRPEIDRWQLRDLLLSGVPKERIVWGRKVSEVKRQEDGSMTVVFADGSSRAGFKLVVGADGAWPKLTTDKPTYSGFTYLQLHIAPSNPSHASAAALVGRGTLFAATAGRAIIAQRLADGSYNVYAALRLPEHWATHNAALIASPQLREWIVSPYFPDWDPQIADLVRRADPHEENFYAWAMYQLAESSLDRESVPGVTLIGDAAHLALSNGEGVNCAMYDALVLAREIAQAGLEGLDEAVRRYEEDMRPRGKEHIADGQMMAERFFAEDAPKGLREFLAQMAE